MGGGGVTKPPEHPPPIQRPDGAYLPGVPVYGGLPFSEFPHWAHPHWPLGDIGSDPLHPAGKKSRKLPRVWRGKDLDMVVFGRDERLEWARKTGMFLARARTALGDRRLHRSAWGGSVIDSVVGAMLTQNVSDVLSSHAIMNLAAKFPGKGATTTTTAAAAAARAGQFYEDDDDGTPPSWGEEDREEEEDEEDGDGIEVPRNVRVRVDIVVEPASCLPDAAAAGGPNEGFIFSPRPPPVNDNDDDGDGDGGGGGSSSPFSSPPSSPSRNPAPQPSSPAQQLALMPTPPSCFSSSGSPQPQAPPPIFMPQGLQGLITAANGARAYFAAAAASGLGMDFGFGLVRVGLSGGQPPPFVTAATTTTTPTIPLQMRGAMFGPPLPPPPPTPQSQQRLPPPLVPVVNVPRFLMLPATPLRNVDGVLPFGPALPPPMNVNKEKDDDDDDESGGVTSLAHLFTAEDMDADTIDLSRLGGGGDRAMPPEPPTQPSAKPPKPPKKKSKEQLVREERAALAAEALKTRDPSPRPESSWDMIDWDAVMRAPVDQVVECIRQGLPHVYSHTYDIVCST